MTDQTREAVARAIDPTTGSDPLLPCTDGSKNGRALAAADRVLAALARIAGMEAGEPVAWRRRPKDSDRDWTLFPTDDGQDLAFYRSSGRYDIEPLYATPAAALARAERAEALRPEVLAFAHLMEAQLRANDHKPGWKGDTPYALHRRMMEEVREVLLAITPIYEGNEYHCPPAEIAREAADVANFAMMIADVCGALSPAPTVKGEGE